jgi:hypothetical protein
MGSCMWFDHPRRWKNELHRLLRHTLCKGRVNEWGFNSLKSSMKSFNHRVSAWMKFGVKVLHNSTMLQWGFEIQVCIKIQNQMNVCSITHEIVFVMPQWGLEIKICIETQHEMNVCFLQAFHKISFLAWTHAFAEGTNKGLRYFMV